MHIITIFYRRYSWLILALTYMPLQSSHAQDVSLPYIDASKGDSIKEWLILGPFMAAANEDPIAIDFIARYGVKESALTPDSIEALKHEFSSLRQSSTQIPYAIAKHNAEFLDFQDIFGRGYFSEGEIPKAAVYAACNVFSAIDRTAYIHFGSDDGAKLWLNGELLHSTSGRRALKTYSDCAKIHLRKGPNLLVFKVQDFGIYWGLTARITTQLDDAIKTALTSQRTLNSNLLLHSIVESFDAIKLKIAGAPDEVSGTMSFYDRNENLLGVTTIDHQGPKTTPPNVLGEGVYRTSLSFDGNIYSEGLVVGDPTRIFNDLLRTIQAKLTNADLSLTVNILCQRFDVLMRPNIKTSANKDWERKVVFVLQEMTEIAKYASDSTNKPLSLPGLHLRGFRSAIDGQVECYRIFVPTASRSAPEGVPLIVVIPTVVSTTRPFIESPFIAAHEEAEALARMANRTGSAILWIGFRNNLYGHPCEFTHDEEVFASVFKNYNIDKTRVSLLGACSAGWIGSMMALRWPERFASMGYLNPTYHRRRNTFSDRGEYRGFSAYRNWISENDPLPGLFDLRNVPMLVVHDGAEPGHGPLAESSAFMALAKARGFPATLEVRPQTEGQHFASWERLIVWLAKQKRISASERRDEQRLADPSSGPIARAFSAPFMLVEGIGRDQRETDALKRLSREFQDAWRTSNFGECRVVSADRVSDADEREYNLILVGNRETNLLWSRLADRLRISLKDHEVRVDEKIVTGKTLSAQIGFPHPEYPKRQVVFVGAADLSAARFGTMDLSVDGWFDYSIWECGEKEHPKLLVAERRSKKPSKE